MSFFEAKNPTRPEEGNFIDCPEDRMSFCQLTNPFHAQAKAPCPCSPTDSFQTWGPRPKQSDQALSGPSPHFFWPTEHPQLGFLEGEISQKYCNLLCFVFFLYNLSKFGNSKDKKHWYYLFFSLKVPHRNIRRYYFFISDSLKAPSKDRSLVPIFLFLKFFLKLRFFSRVLYFFLFR